MAIASKANAYLVESLCNEGQINEAADALFKLTTAPSKNVYFSLLKACNKSRASYPAKQVYVHLSKHAQQLSGYFGDYLVMTLARCDAIEDALCVSQTLPHLTVFSWTALISAYVNRGQASRALQLYESMKNDGVQPNHYTLVALLKACGSIADVESIRALHVDAQRMGLITDVYICTTLINVYGRCGSIDEAENVFSGPIQHDVVTWNAMLAAYIDQGLEMKALRLFRQIYVENVTLDELMFVSALQACVILIEKRGGSEEQTALHIGTALHADAQKTGFCQRPFLLTTLVNMYSKSGNIASVEDLMLSAHTYCNSVTWNAMMAAYLENKHEIKCVQLFKYMHEQGMKIDQYAFVTVLQACGKLWEREKSGDMNGESLRLMSFELCKALHVDAEKLDILNDIFACNTLIRIYGKYGAIAEAEDLFCMLHDRDLVTWNSLISVYVEHSQGEKALLLYKKMREDAVNPGPLTFVMFLQACGQLAEKEEWTIIDGREYKLMSLEIGLELHDDIQERDLANDITVGDSLLRMYTKCGALVHAEDIFAGLHYQCDVRFWTAMLSAYVEHGYAEKALQLYAQMYKENMAPDQHTLVMAIHACGILAETEEAVESDGHLIKPKSLEIGTLIHSDAQRLCNGLDLFINNTLVSMYGKCGAIHQALNLFVGMGHKDEVSWNAMFSAYLAGNLKAERVLQLYREMQADGVSAGQLTFVIVLQACNNILEARNFDAEKESNLYLYEIIQAIYSDAKSHGFSSDITINNTLISIYGKLGHLQEAEAVFCAMTRHDEVTWTVILSSFIERDEVEKALGFYMKMQNECPFLDELSLIVILRACKYMGMCELCHGLHFVASFHGLDLLPSLAVTLLDTYGNCGCTPDAKAVFSALHEPDIASWNACIASYAGEGDCEATMHTLEEVHLSGSKPNEVSFASALNAYAHNGLVALGLQSFDCMSRYSGLKVSLAHYTILVDMLGRSGCFVKVDNMLDMMPMKTDVTMWKGLLGCCRTHGNLEVGERAFNHVVKLQPDHSAAYIMLSNLYVEAIPFDFQYYHT
ncbi:hypothetical protein KP509_23G026100 [Ceratopteris richardii]|uniref:Pentatricopeptide repeat-containing protein n=1 Tax=Ceratopteris richardii TaxID=49495 RepID=A0A8T2RYD2_CERRI|nr:hypothetical protein KP509_23G026100 [Ceratopteris richardii]